MPIKRLKYTFNYCIQNIPTFILVLVLIFLLNNLNDYYDLFEGNHLLIIYIVTLFLFSTLHGYGLMVTRDNINNGSSLPKLLFFKSFVLGIKSVIITGIYAVVQYVLYHSISVIFELPVITVEEGEISISNIGSLFNAHNSLDTMLFFIFICISIYLFTFFLEISLARLADKGSLLDALNIKDIVNCINTIGWGNYTVDYTKIILSIAILSYLSYGIRLMGDHHIIEMIIGLIIFLIQYIGIGKIYRIYKDKKYGQIYQRPRRKTPYQK